MGEIEEGRVGIGIQEIEKKLLTSLTKELAGVNCQGFWEASNVQLPNEKGT